MARSFTIGSGQTLAAAESCIADYPFSWMVWTYTPADTDTVMVVGGVTTSGTTPRSVLTIRLGGSQQFYQYLAQAGVNTGTMPLAAWNCVVVVSRSKFDHSIWMNGVETTSTIDGGVISNSNETYFGNNTLTASISRVAFWNIALDGTDVATLTEGYSPTLVQPGSLTNFFPMSGPAATDDEVDTVGGVILLQTSDPPVVGGPAEVYPANAERSRIIFPRYLDIDTGYFPSPPWTIGLKRFANGGNIFSGDMNDPPNPMYDIANGDVIPANLPVRLANLPTGAVCSIDIEAFGYNDYANLAGQRQFDMMTECRAVRPDCKWGYYSSFARTVNSAAVGPADAAAAQAFWNQVVDSAELASYVDFLAPQLYVPYIGPITDGNGDGLNGVPAFISDSWPPNSTYGFTEWSAMAKVRIDACKMYGKPVYPYMSPYSIQNLDSGAYGTGDYPYIGFFAEAVDFILDNADGMIFYDFTASDTYTEAVKSEIYEVLRVAMGPYAMIVANV